MTLPNIVKLTLAAISLIAAIWVFGDLRFRETIESGDGWHIRNNAIRQLLTRSSASEYVVICNNYATAFDLLICGKSTPDTIDKLIRDLGVAKNELVDQQGYSFHENWSKVMPEGKWQFQFEPGSVLVEDFVQDERRFFVVLLYSPKTAHYVITVGDASKILQRMK